MCWPSDTGHWTPCNCLTRARCCVRIDTGTPDFLAADIRIVKWRTAKDGRNGVLEFKLTESMIQVEEELVRVLIQKGGKLQSGPDARGRRVRAVEEQLEGTW